MTLVVLPFAAALVWASSLPRVDQATLAEGVRDTAAVVRDHSAAMVRIGERISAAATASIAADRSVWIAYGQHMATDGRSLEALAARLQQTAVAAEVDQMHRGNVDVAVAVLAARWEQLEADGRATAAHGRVMMAMAADLTAGVRAGILSDADVQEIRSASAGMADAGERIVRTAELLLSSVDQMQRWMAIPH